MSYASAEFDPGVGSPSFPCATAVFDDQLWVIGGSGALTQTVLSLSGLDIEAGGATDPDVWVTTKLSMPGNTINNSARCAAAVGGQSLRLFWNQHGAGIYSSAYDLGPSAWGPQIQLRSTDRDPIAPTSSADVSVTAFTTDENGNTIFIVGCANVKLNNVQGLYLGVFNAKDINIAESVWPSTVDQLYTAAQLTQMNPLGGTMTNPGNALSLEWFPTGASINDVPTFLLAVNLFTQVSGTGQTNLCCLLPLAPDASSIEAGATYLTGKAACANALVREPAGRLQFYSQSPGPNYIEVVNLGVPLPGETGFQQVEADPGIILATRNISNVSPSCSFVVGAPTTVAKMTSYPVYRFVFYKTSSVKCQVQRFGTAEVSTVGSNVPLQATRPLNVLRGIIDGPIPVPDANINLTTFPPGPTVLATVSYGTERSVDSGHTDERQWTVGIKTSGGVTKGVGPVWDAAASGGIGGVYGQTTGIIVTSATTNLTTIDPDSPAGQNRVEAAGGLVRCATVQITCIAFGFVDLMGKQVSDPLSSSDDGIPKVALFQTTLADDGTPAQYTPFSVTPGDLSSYTPQSWNKQMNTLGYPGDDYFTNVIEANAYKFADANYLQFEWSSTGRVDEDFGVVTSDYVESSWSLDASLYTGFGAEEEFSIFGLGWGATVSAMAGLSVSDKTVSSSTTSEQWGIGLGPEGTWGPPASTVPGTIASYAFRAYFLPPPTEDPTSWTKELIANLPSDPPPGELDPHAIDPNSACWRIVFVVTAYTFNGPTAPYIYSGT